MSKARPQHRARAHGGRARELDAQPALDHLLRADERRGELGGEDGFEAFEAGGEIRSSERVGEGNPRPEHQQRLGEGHGRGRQQQSTSKALLTLAS